MVAAREAKIWFRAATFGLFEKVPNVKMSFLSCLCCMSPCWKNPYFPNRSSCWRGKLRVSSNEIHPSAFKWIRTMDVHKDYYLTPEPDQSQPAFLSISLFKPNFFHLFQVSWIIILPSEQDSVWLKVSQPFSWGSNGIAGIVNILLGEPKRQLLPLQKTISRDNWIFKGSLIDTNLINNDGLNNLQWFEWNGV